VASLIKQIKIICEILNFFINLKSFNMKHFSITLFALTTLLLASCNEDYLERDNISTEKSRKIEELNFSHKEKLRLEFGRAFALAIKENPELRAFIKEEALKMFNKDYDVMYQLVKNKPLSGVYYRTSSNVTTSYSTMRELLLNYFESENVLIEIESQLPLLTIFVPELPEDTFSAHTWDANNPDQIPVIAIRMDSTNEIPMIDVVNNHEYVLEIDLIPGYPVVVIKDNERLQLKTSNIDNLTKSTATISNGEGLEYKFLSDAFNPEFNPSEMPTTAFTPISNSWWPNSGCNWDALFVPGRQNTVTPFLQNAYNVFDGQITDFWMRDNIYYQQTPSNVTGAFTGGRYRETITWFKLKGSPQLVWNMLADQSNTTGDSDPMITNQNWSRDRLSAWTDGQFEISVSCTDNSKTRSVINTYLTLPFSPNQLFTFTHDVITRHRWAGLSPRRYWRPRINGFVAVDMLQASSISARFMFNNWSLFQYSNTWSYEWKEVDNTVAQSNDSFAERKYNTNIEGSVSGGNETKFGLKWGASLQQTASTTRTNRWTVGSDIFSNHDVNFYDKILNKNPCNNFLYPRIYDAGSVQFEIRPIQVEF
jgi:hypothetical protein